MRTSNDTAMAIGRCLASTHPFALSAVCIIYTLRRHDPQKISRIDMLLQKFDQSLLSEALLAKYGALPDSWQNPNDLDTETDGLSKSSEKNNVAEMAENAEPTAADECAGRRYSRTADSSCSSSSDDDDYARFPPAQRPGADGGISGGNGESNLSPRMMKRLMGQTVEGNRAPPTVEGSLLRQLEEFYREREPSKVRVAARLLQLHPLADLKRAILDKYGAVPSGWQHIPNSEPSTPV